MCSSLVARNFECLQNVRFFSQKKLETLGNLLTVHGLVRGNVIRYKITELIHSFTIYFIFENFRTLI